MACGYDTEAVLEMLSDMKTDNGIGSDNVYSTEIVIVFVVKMKYIWIAILKRVRMRV